MSRITKYEADPIIQANWYIKSSVPFDKNKCEIKVLAPGAAATLRPCIYISINGLPGKRGDFSLELYADDVQSANLEDRLTK